MYSAIQRAAGHHTEAKRNRSLFIFLERQNGANLRQAKETVLPAGVPAGHLETKPKLQEECAAILFAFPPEKQE
jgi:hypothetical protein